MKINKFNESFDNTEADLLKCEFEKITEDEIPNYTGDKDDDLSSYQSDNVYEFGYLGYDDFCIVKLDENRGDDVLRYKDGSNNFIIKYNNQLYMGSFSEGENSVKEEKKYGGTCTEHEMWDDFRKEMKKNNLDFFYCVNF